MIEVTTAVHAMTAFINGVPREGIFIPIPSGTELKENTKYKIEIKRPSKKRSLDANGYCWLLCQKIAENVSRDGTYISKDDVYRRAIQNSGEFVDMAVTNAAVDKTIKAWQSNGLGWLTENLGAARNLKNCTKLRCYYGSHVYDTRQMSRLIDCLVDECMQLGIQTRPQEDIDSLIKEWGDE